MGEFKFSKVTGNIADDFDESTLRSKLEKVISALTVRDETDRLTVIQEKILRKKWEMYTLALQKKSGAGSNESSREPDDAARDCDVIFCSTSARCIASPLDICEGDSPSRRSPQ